MARTTAWMGPAGLGFTLLGLSCSLAIDVAIECKSSTDCAGRGGDDTLYTCGEQGTCEPASCELDADCSGLGEGFEDSVCEDGVCAPPLCESDSECQMELETDSAVCEAGRCQDPRWGCVGREDPREPEGDFASFEMTLIDAVTREPIVAPSDVSVCEKNDPSCDNALQVGVDYDEKTGLLQVERIRQGFTGFVRIQGDSPTGIPYLEARFFFASRPVINEEVAEDPIVMLTEGVAQALSVQAGINPPVDPERGLFLSRIHDCQGALVGGVTLVSDDPGLADDRILFYADDDFLPNQERSITFDNGVAGLANILKDEPDRDRVIDLQVFEGEQRITDFTINFQPSTVSHAFIYPGYD